MEIKFEDNVKFRYLGFNGQARILIKSDKRHFNINTHRFIFCMYELPLEDFQNKLLRYISFKNIPLLFDIDVQYAEKINNRKKEYFKSCQLCIEINDSIIFKIIEYPITNRNHCLFQFTLSEDEMEELYLFIKNIRIDIYEDEINSNTNSLEL